MGLITKHKTWIILIFSSITTVLSYLNEDMLNKPVLWVLLPLTGIISTLLFSGFLWLSIPLYDYLNGYYKGGSNSKTESVQNKAPFLLFIIISGLINILLYSTQNITILSLIYDKSQ
ncbi:MULTISPECIES: hypothetical protein [unclassified Myroides]|uniref:hypothetical protein n=1 Tax=unclassified Myroides TaxID=2642485 RepID=UPI003D2F8B52